MKKDYYEILGVPKNANENDIKKAYRKLAMEHHPDRNHGNKDAEEKFKEVSEAYEVLKDPDKKRQYDQFGHVSSRGSSFEGFGGFDFDLGDALRTFMSEGFGFGDFFGNTSQGRSRGYQQQGADLQIRLKLSLEEIASGVEKKIKLKRYNKCTQCNGSGAKKESMPVTCPYCKGAGEIRQVSRSFIGQFVNIAPCTQCQGTGTIIGDPCSICKGEGRIRGENEIKVKIPAGVSTGNYITLSGEGHAGLKGGPAGTAIIIIEETEHPDFERHGDDILNNLKLNFSQVALGDQVEVNTLNGKSKLTIDPGTQTNKILRMKGKGIPHLNNHGRGDQLVRIIVETPTNLSEKHKKLFKELAEIS
jgi:molecular chaperone DnaJ